MLLQAARAFDAFDRQLSKWYIAIDIRTKIFMRNYNGLYVYPLCSVEHHFIVSYMCTKIFK